MLSPGPLPRLVPFGGAEVCGKWFPAGVELSMSASVVYRRPEAYGPDAAVFRPERWLEADKEQKSIYERNLLTVRSQYMSVTF